jgi:predicted outer membrane protein
MGAMMPQGGLDFLRLKDQIGQQEVALTQRELERHQGADFDRAYIGQEIVAHLGMLAELQTIRNYAGGEFRTVVDQGIQTTQRHLEHARQIMQQLNTQQPSTTARRPGEESR